MPQGTQAAARSIKTRSGIETELCIQLNPRCDIWLAANETVLLRRQDGLHHLEGRFPASVCRHLAYGARPISHILSDLVSTETPSVVGPALSKCKDMGLLADVDSALSSPEWPVDPTLLAERCPQVGTVSVVPVPSLWQLALTAVQGPWVPLTATADRLTLGPIFGLGTDSCRTCLATRAHEDDDLAALAASNSLRRLAYANWPHDVLEILAAWIAPTVERLRAEKPGSVAVRWADTNETTMAVLRPMGGCPDCHAPVEHPLVPRGTDAGLRNCGYRPLSSKAFVEGVTPRLVDPLFGPIRKIETEIAAEHAADDDVAATCTVRHSFPLAWPDASAVLRNQRGRSAGKGRSLDDAVASGLAEAIERYAGVYRPKIDHPKIARPSDLQGPVIASNDWTLYSADQLAASSDWRALDDPAGWVPDPIFDADRRPRAWIQVRDLQSGEPGWAPAELCWHQMPVPSGCVSVGRADSNGCAAGQSLADARLQGLLELIERDAVGIWWWMRCRRPALALNSEARPVVASVLHRLCAIDYRLGLFDLTHDLGLPIVAAVGWPAGGLGAPLLGFGAHLEAEIAVSRAVTEVAQCLPPKGRVWPKRDPRGSFVRIPHSKASNVSAEEELAFLIPDENPTEALEMSAQVPETAREAEAFLVSRLAQRGIRTWWLDQSRPDLPIPVVRMIAPGLRHFRPRLAPGRLNSVPDDLGWQGDPAGPNTLFIPG